MMQYIPYVMATSTTCIARCLAVGGRRRMSAVFLVVVLSFTGVLATLYYSHTSHLPREDSMELNMANMQVHLKFLDSLYKLRQEDVFNMETNVLTRAQKSAKQLAAKLYGKQETTLSPEVVTLLQNMTGMRAADGILETNLEPVRMPFYLQLLPHLMNNPYSLTPAYHMRVKNRETFAEVVIGVPTVKRDKESYIMITLSHLISGMSDKEARSTLIVVLIGETDVHYVISTAREIESMFPKHVEDGIIEVLAPAASFYPDLDNVEASLGDSLKRVRWRTKQNLDTMFLMAYAHTKANYYLMLEDDVIAKKKYMHEIRAFTSSISVSNPRWFFIEFCHVGGIGKLFRSSDLIHFITYLQLFYANMPIDWLLESYLADKVCTIDKFSKACSKNKLSIRPKYRTSLFQHIGLYSSLKGKMQRVEVASYGAVPLFYPHDNPPLDHIRCDIKERSENTIKKAYEGLTFFWGVKPKRGDLVEFWFQKPTAIESYTFRSGNVKHISDRFYHTILEVLPAVPNANFTVVDVFDEFGLADGKLSHDIGPLSAIRLRVTKDSAYWVILSEIDLRLVNNAS